MKEKSDSKGTDSLLKYKQYALDVVQGKQIACKYVIQACERYLSWFDSPDKFIFRPEKCDAVISLISKLKHSSGRFNRKPFILLQYQKWMIYSIFGWYYKDDPEKRVTKKIYIELARKQGKTAFLSAISLYCLLETPAAEVYMVSNNAKQAKICFDMSSNFLSSIDPKAKFFERYRDSIRFNATKSKIQVLSNNSSGNDGFSPSFFVLDEAHEQPDSKAWDVMISGQGARYNDNCLAAIITTAGFNKYLFCYEYRQTCTEILSGLKTDDSQFIAIYTQDEEDDIFNDEECWIKSNPSLGVTVSKEYLREQVVNAQNNTSLLTGVLTKNFNQWVDSMNVWLTHDEILNVTCDVNLEDFDPDNTIIWAGVDLASTSDLTSLSIMIVQDEIYYFKSWPFLPASALQQNVNAEFYKKMARNHHLIATNGNVCDYSEVTKVLLQIAERFTIGGVFYDSWNATQWAIDCTAQGLPLTPISQSLGSFNRCTKEFERLVKMGNCRIDNNPITRWCFDNVELKFDHNENCKPVKKGDAKSGKGKIDIVISMLSCLNGYLLEPQFDTSI
nr:MAG TPA: Large Terminase [Caudoviricetes sp.]